MKTRVATLAIGAFAVCAFGSGPARAGDVETRGEVGVETRVFQDDSDPGTQDQGVAAVARLAASWKEGDWQVKARGFVRHDETDRGRSAAFAEEAWAEWRIGKTFRLRAGWDMLTWSATEAFHPADVINSRYFDSSVENFEKVGELMAQLRAKFLQGNVSAHFMPVFTSPIFPSSRSRLAFVPPGTPFGDALWVRRNGEVTDGSFGVQWALQVQQTVGDADVSLHVIQNQDRFHPIVAIDPVAMSAAPVFLPVTQVGGTLQQALGGMMLKIEAAYRVYDRPTLKTNLLGVDFRPLSVPNWDHGIVAVGLERSLQHDNGWEMTFILEGQGVFGEGKGFFGTHKTTRRQLELFQRDVMGGLRLAFNDVDSKALLLFVVVDAERPQEVFANLGYEQRLGDEWSVKTGVRIFNLPPRDPQNPVLFENWHKNNMLYLTLLHHF